MMIANLAEFNKEKQQFEVKVGGETKAVTELSSDDLEALKERPKTLEDAAMQQLDYVSTINNNVAAILNSLPAAAAATRAQLDTERLARGTFEAAGDVITKSFKDAKIREEVDSFTKELGGSLDDIISALSSGDAEKIRGIFDNLSKVSNVGFEETFDRFKTTFSDSLSKIPQNLSDILGDENIYMGLGETIKGIINNFGDQIKETFNQSMPTTTQTGAETTRTTPPLQEQQSTVQSAITEARINAEIEVEDFVIKALPEDTIKVIGGTNIPPAGADITNILNNQTNNTQALTSIQPIAPREIITPQVQANATPVANEQKELRVKFDPFIVKLEGDGKSIEMALQDNVVRDKIIDMVGKAMTSDYNTMGRPILGVRS
jgi:hypothetical protein